MSDDACQTPGCGHAAAFHRNINDTPMCLAKGQVGGPPCPCTAYFPSRPVPEDAEGDHPNWHRTWSESGRTVFCEPQHVWTYRDDDDGTCEDVATVADDGIKLTRDEREHLEGAICDYSDGERWPKVCAAVESIVAARVQALTAEVERLKRRPKHRDFELVELSRDAARAELAAANDRLERVRALAEWKLTAPSTVLKSEIRAALGDDA